MAFVYYSVLLLIMLFIIVDLCHCR